jgi:Carboxylesterase family
MRKRKTQIPRRSGLLCGGLALTLSANVLLGVEKDPTPGASRWSYPPVLPGARAETYKRIGKTNLQLYIYTPKGRAPTNGHPAIVFFFGGGWATGTPQQFEKHCQYFASRGMVAITADYRVGSAGGHLAACTAARQGPTAQPTHQRAATNSSAHSRNPGPRRHGVRRCKAL